MPKVFNINSLNFTSKNAEVVDYNWETSQRLGALCNSKNLIFDIRKLEPNKYSFPYHFHYNSEEIFLILEGSCTLRTPEGKKILKKGDIVFFEVGPEGAHQLYNHSDELCLYFDLRTNLGLDVAEYPDSNKVALLPQFEIISKGKGSTTYYDGEDLPDLNWGKNEE